MVTIRNARNETAAEVNAEQKWVLAISLCLESVTDAWRFQQAIDGELKAGGQRRVLVDARRAKLSTKEINESMWAWVRSNRHFDCLAIVNESPVLSVAAQMKATSIGTTKVKVFHSLEEATRWLLANAANE
jgi:hypothetical protein